MSVSEELAALGLALPKVATPIGAYTPAVVADGLVYTSGQLALQNAALLAAGRVGADVSTESARAAARIAALNALAAAAQVVGGVDNLGGVVKVTVFVACTPEFTEQPAVANGASGLFGQVFGESGIHARSAVGVAALPLGASVEVEAVFRLAG